MDSEGDVYVRFRTAIVCYRGPRVEGLYQLPLAVVLEVPNVQCLIGLPVDQRHIDNIAVVSPRTELQITLLHTENISATLQPVENLKLR